MNDPAKIEENTPVIDVPTGEDFKDIREAVRRASLQGLRLPVAAA